MTSSMAHVLVTNRETPGSGVTALPSCRYPTHSLQISLTLERIANNRSSETPRMHEMRKGALTCSKKSSSQNLRGCFSPILLPSKKASYTATNFSLRGGRRPLAGRRKDASVLIVRIPSLALRSAIKSRKSCGTDRRWGGGGFEVRAPCPRVSRMPSPSTVSLSLSLCLVFLGSDIRYRFSVGAVRVARGPEVNGRSGDKSAEGRFFNLDLT
jgi:hypothetical protein